MKLKNLKNAPIEIASILASNGTIVRLIYDDEPSVLLNKKTISLSIEELINQNYIGFYPATETGINSIDRNTFIIINSRNINIPKNIIMYVIPFKIVFHNSSFELNAKN